VRRYLRIRGALCERVGAPAGASDDAVREALLALPHEELLAALDPREVEDLEYGYRERVNDLHLPHVRELPRVLPGIFAAAARARGGGRLRRRRAALRARVHDGGFLSRLNARGDGYGGASRIAFVSRSRSTAATRAAGLRASRSAAASSPTR
jgi:hypothetical protein